MGKKIEWLSDKLTTMFGKDSTSTTLVIIIWILYRLADSVGVSDEIFISVVGIVANVYHNLEKQDKATLLQKVNSQEKTLFLLGHGVDPDKTELLYTKAEKEVEKKDLPEPPV